MFILSSGNYRKCSAHVSRIIVFAVAIGRAQVGCREREMLETLMLSERKNCSMGYETIELPWSLLKGIFLLVSEHP